MKDKAVRDKKIIDDLRNDLQNRTIDYFRMREMLYSMYEVASKATTDNDVQIELNNIMLQDHFARKQIPPNGNYTEEES